MINSSINNGFNSTLSNGSELVAVSMRMCVMMMSMRMQSLNTCAYQFE